MKILHAVAGLASRFGGPSRSVPRLCMDLSSCGMEVTVVSPESGGLSDDARVLPERGIALELHRVSPFGRVDGGVLTRLVTASRLVHVHGAWTPFNHQVAITARRAGVPLVISPRGMLQPWALAHHRWRKRAAWALFQRRDLDGAALLHATAASEAQQLRALGFANPLAVVPNGVELPPPAPETAAPRRVILFLSRLHPKKGALILIEALARVAAQARTGGWSCVIAGPDEDGHGRELRSAAERLGLGTMISFPGPLDGPAKWLLYRSAGVFVLPSFSENFGLVVAEALRSETAVIATTGTPWRELAERRCGWWVDATVDAVAEALAQALSLDDDARREMGRRGRLLVEERYEWPGVAAAMAAAYRWVVAAAGPMPAHVSAGR